MFVKSRSPLRMLTGFLSISLFIGCGLIGCGAKPADAPKAELHPFTGIVLVDSEPASGAVVTLHAVGDSLLGAVTPNGVADDIGVFSVCTYAPGDGVPAGKYKVTVSWTEILNPGASEPEYGKSKIPLRYSNPESSGLEVEVAAGHNEPRTFELKSR